MGATKLHKMGPLRCLTLWGGFNSLVRELGTKDSEVNIRITLVEKRKAISNSS